MLGYEAVMVFVQDCVRGIYDHFDSAGSSIPPQFDSLFTRGTVHTPLGEFAVMSEDHTRMRARVDAEVAITNREFCALLPVDNVWAVLTGVVGSSGDGGATESPLMRSPHDGSEMMSHTAYPEAPVL